MSQLKPDVDPRDLRWQIRELLQCGRFDDAMALCSDCLAKAEELDDQDLRDLAICNRGNILVNQGDDKAAATDLRKILMRSADPYNCFLAAYGLSQHHELIGENPRSLFYARLALDHGHKSELPDFIAFANNRIGNLMMLDSYFEEACEHYQKALDLLPAREVMGRALSMSNQGYCLTVLGRYNDGIKSLFKSLDLMRLERAGAWERFPRLGLCYAYLELGRLDQARAHGRRALELSETAGSAEDLKNSLYLLGEIEKLAGNEADAYEHFWRLQAEFYPDQPFIPDFLMETDIRKLINLMA
jgi:tetratricopeptide (TPR) repeat protein